MENSDNLRAARGIFHALLLSIIFYVIMGIIYVIIWG